jgi:hypothetical protein
MFSSRTNCFLLEARVWATRVGACPCYYNHFGAISTSGEVQRRARFGTPLSTFPSGSTDMLIFLLILQFTSFKLSNLINNNNYICIAFVSVPNLGRCMWKLVSQTQCKYLSFTHIYTIISANLCIIHGSII